MLGAPLTVPLVVRDALAAVRRSALFARLRKCAAADEEFFRICLQNLHWAQGKWFAILMDWHREIQRIVEAGGGKGKFEMLIIRSMVAKLSNMSAHMESLRERFDDAKRRDRELLSEYQALAAELMANTFDADGHNGHSQGSDAQETSARFLEELRLATIAEVITAKEQEQDVNDARRWEIMRRTGDVPVFPCPFCELMPLPDTPSQPPLPPPPDQSPNLPVSPVASPHGRYVL